MVEAIKAMARKDFWMSFIGLIVIVDVLSEWSAVIRPVCVATCVIGAVAIRNTVVVSIASAVNLSTCWRTGGQGDCEYRRQSGDTSDAC